MALKLKRFNTDTLYDNSVIVIVGKRATGKTTLAKHILSLFHDIPRGIVFSTESPNTYGYDNQDIEVSDEYDPELLGNFIDEQQARIQSVRKGDSKEDVRGFVVFDDNIYSTNRADKHIRNIFMNGRHYKLLIIVMIQNPRMSPETRSNTDFVFLLRENILKSRRMMYENFGGIVPKFETFNAILEHCTDDYGSLVINNTTRTPNITENLFWYNIDKGFLEEQELMEAKEIIHAENSSAQNTEVNDEEEDGGCSIC